MRECRHADRVENKLIFKLPVYLKKAPPKDLHVLRFDTPDYYVERSYCTECMAESIDRIYNRSWWEFWK